MNEDIRLLTKVATLYYLHHLSQRDIATRLSLSRQTVGRLLQRAYDLGIVKIEIRSDLTYASEIELQLEQTFHLHEVVVVSPVAETDDAIKAAIGVATAEFLERRIKNGDVIGLASGSTTLYQCALHLRRAYLPGATVVSLTGSAPRSPSPYHTIVHMAGVALGAKTVMLPAPAFVDRADIKAALVSDSNIAAVLQLGHRANIAVFGVGMMSEENSPYKQGLVDYDLIQDIKAKGAVGEICGHAYNLSGEVCAPEISDRTIAIELTNLRQKELSIAAAGGTWKLDALWGALHGGYCNVLITDEMTARALIARAQDGAGISASELGKFSSARVGG